MPSVTAEEFLKEDYRTSPRFKINPKEAKGVSQVRFMDDKAPQGGTVKRTHVGSRKDYAEQYELIKKQE